MSDKKGGIVLRISDGKYAGKKAIAYRANQNDKWTKENKIAVVIFEDDNYQNKIADNILISTSKCRQIGFVD